jgi:hypothetical protein
MDAVLVTVRSGEQVIVGDGRMPPGRDQSFDSLLRLERVRHQLTPGCRVAIGLHAPPASRVLALDAAMKGQVSDGVGGGT